MNFFHALKYLEYMVFSGHGNGHGIHSPFIFDLVSRLFRNKTGSDIVFNIEKIRKELMKDRRLITVNDLGTGSEKHKSNIRKVSEIARYSAVPLKYGILLSNFAAEFGASSVIELGTSFGISTMYLAASGKARVVYTIEGCSGCAGIAKENFRVAGLKNIELFTGSFDTELPLIISSGIKPGLVFIDGNHRKEPVLKYFGMIEEISDDKTVFIIDDIYDSREMSEAWNEIKQSGNVSATIDIFRMGIVFFRKGITRNNYIIRY